MSRTTLLGTLALLVLLLSACTSDAVRRAAYEAAYQKGCIDRERSQNCDPAHKSYDEYKEDRDNLVKPER